MARTKDKGKAAVVAVPPPSTSIDEIFASSSKIKLAPLDNDEESDQGQAENHD